MATTRYKTVLGLGILVAVLGLAAWRLLAPVAHAGQCDLSSQVCSVSRGDQRFEVELLPRHPAPGEELRLVLRAAGGAPPELGTEPLTVEFSMPGMDMGDHAMTLEPTGTGALEGRIALPSCPMGHSLWQASIRIGEEPLGDLVLHVRQ
ncbi:MAG: hypothetical protein KDD11_03665 [Acidobacteria bacterium]|nr:hypothetical protein [Acidobacteriota bacterium]